MLTNIQNENPFLYTPQGEITMGYECMPVMNGLEATTAIRKFNQMIPIIALTANVFDSDRENTLAAACNSHFMTKPAKKHELMELLPKYNK